MLQNLENSEYHLLGGIFYERITYFNIILLIEIEVYILKYDSFKEYLQLNYLGVINKALEEWIQENELNEFESYIVNNIKVTCVYYK